MMSRRVLALPSPPPLPFLCHFLITSLSLILKVLLSASFSCQSELYTAARAKSTPSTYINSATHPIPWDSAKMSVCLSLKTRTWNPWSLSVTQEWEESVQPKECNADLHLINSVDKQFSTSKASQHCKWGAERQQQRCPIPLSALPLSQALQTWGGRSGRRRKAKPLLFPLLPSPNQELTWSVLLTKGHLQRDSSNSAARAEKRQGERGREAEMLVHLWSMLFSFRPLSRACCIEDARGW